MRIILTGYRGTGKSTVAALLAERLGCEYVDSDDEIERCAGRTIAAIFAEDGEEAFRDLESERLAELCGRENLVLGAGGGAVLREKNRELLRQSGQIVWLKAEPETIHRRVSGDQSTSTRRPNLTNSGGLTEIVEVLTQRTPIYRKCADLEVDTENKTPAEVADEIIDRLSLGRSASEP